MSKVRDLINSFFGRKRIYYSNASYIIYRDKIEYLAINGRNGNVDFSDSDAIKVINPAIKQINSGVIALLSDIIVSKPILVTNKNRVIIDGNGHILTNISSSDYAIRLQSFDGLNKYGHQIRNMKIVCNYTSNHGILLEGGSFQYLLENIHIYEPTYGIKILNSTHWHEQFNLKNIIISNPQIGIECERTNGTDSLGYGYLENVGITLDKNLAKGIHIPSNMGFGICTVNKFNIWFGGSYKDNHIGMDLDCDMSDTVLINPSFESFYSGTPISLYGINLGSNVTGKFYLLGLRQYGNLTEVINNPYSKEYKIV